MEFLHNNLLFLLREATLDDVAAMTELEHRINPQGWSRENFVSSISSSHVCQVLELDHAIVAYVISSTAADEAELLNIVVSPDYHRQGIASRLLELVCDSFNETIHSFFLEVRASNKPALCLYDTLGFNEVGIRPNYYPALLSLNKQSVGSAYKKNSSKNLSEDAIIMAKSLR
jgi:ribosomal-protein-alanine N-acetyltransferase